MRVRSKRTLLSALAILAVGALAATAITRAEATPSGSDAADGVLRVYSNNIENLVTNNGDPEESCTRVTAPQHLDSILVDDAGHTGTDDVQPPDLLILQQIRGTGQATAYADQLSELLGFEAGTYRAIVAWDDPQEWGGSHHCADPKLGDLKKKQTNAIIYNSDRLNLADGDVSKYWSAGWLPEGADYDGGKGCELYNQDSHDSGSAYQWKWKRTSAIAARFTTKDTGTSVFAATMHLPEGNGKNACGGNGSAGIGDSGIRFGGTATELMENSTVRVVGMDANRKGIAADTLDSLGMTGYGSAPTFNTAKIDYLFASGTVRESPIDHTVDSTRSNHMALYGFIEY